MKIKLINDPITSDYGRNLLRARGVKDVECFLYPDKSALQDWRDLENIKEGVNLIFALSATARIGIIVDCDVDGFTSASIIGQYLTRYLPNLGINYYIHDGKAHGLEEHWEDIRDMNFDLLIVPDAGSNDSEYAKEIKCPILVIDHHLVEEPISAPNMVVINNQLSPKYKNKGLSGSGMAYQFCRAMDFYFDKNFAEDYIDLAALGICGDMMSGLEVENQYVDDISFDPNIENKIKDLKDPLSFLFEYCNNIDIQDINKKDMIKKLSELYQLSIKEND